MGLRSASLPTETEFSMKLTWSSSILLTLKDRFCGILEINHGNNEKYQTSDGGSDVNEEKEYSNNEYRIDSEDHE